MYTIMELVRKTKTSSRSLRVWEEAGLVECTRDSNGVRLFTDDILDRIERIHILKSFGLSLSDISAVLQGKFGELNEILQKRRDEIEQHALRLTSAKQKIIQIEQIVGFQNSAQSFADFLVSPRQAKSLALDALLKNSSPESQNDEQKRFLNDEFSSVDPEETLAWLSALKKVARYASEHEIPLQFVRGFAASHLALRLAGWNTPDPIAENLIPHNPFAQNLHFDVSYTGTEHFFEFVSSVNTTLAQTKLVPFRLPILDILADFSSTTEIDPFRFEPEGKIVSLLSSGDFSHVFLIDESGNTLLERLYPESTSEWRSVEANASDLKRFSPKTKKISFVI